MLLDKLRLRLTTEYGAFRQYLATAPLTAMDLINKSYEIVCKEQITWNIEDYHKITGIMASQLIEKFKTLS